ncbi:helix-turn-helix protein [bacterium BMS3Abin07]|nr:helix-turn-helix protein [bacterium BMS3Abin07]GBE31938.1 helix-turn-helix protein [bacterium BMS3Bbin05]HDL20573.1 XRE family transcriptional regulator [Nitrospirota bacterium]HDO23062.1 XRE family transcriptional regulator [Nitrospirota bacterium]HDZ88784.1 XRE family transcriptional regulator [Nitrospirota bacterium]
MRKTGWFQDLLDKYKDDLEFRMEVVILDFTEKIVRKMEEKDISRAELARRLNVSKAFVTKMLNGNPNLTIKTMMSVADALECDLNLDIYPKGFKAKNFYVSDGKKMDKAEFREYVEPEIGEELDACAA